jgi:hypothetical protein
MELRTGKKIVTVLKLDVTSVKRPLIIIIKSITVGRDRLVKNPSVCAILFDRPEVLLIKRKK